MSKSDDAAGPRPPKFPRHRWKPGQTGRIEQPERGGPYDRPRDRRDADEEIDDALREEPNNNDPITHPDGCD